MIDICYAYPNMYHMGHGDVDGECFLEDPASLDGSYFIPLNKDRLYSNYLIEYTKDGILYAAVANEMQHGFEVELHGIKTVFGLFNTKIHKYVGEYIHPDFKYGLVEVGFKFIDELLKDNILVYGCKNLDRSFKRVEKMDLNVKSIFLSGGIGDIIAIDSLLSDDIKNNIKTVCYGTKQASNIQKMLKSVPEYKNVKNHIMVWEDSSKAFGFTYKSNCLSVDKSFLESADFGIFTLFPQFLSGHLSYNKSSWADHTLCDIKVDLPDEYVVICSYSINNKWENVHGGISEDLDRNFSYVDWKFTLSFLEKKGIKGVVLNGPEFNEPIPNHPNLIDLSGKTDILESIEILKKGKYYIGIAGCLSVLAAKLFPVDHMAIKLTTKYGIVWKRIYWAPHTDFTFLNNVITTSHLTL